MEEKVIDIQELAQDSHNFNKRGAGGIKTTDFTDLTD